MSKTACPSVYNMCWRQYNLYRVLDTGLVRHVRCGWWPVVVTHIDEWGGEDMETGPSTSHLCDVLVFLKWVSLRTHYITYPMGPMIFLTWIGRIIQCLPWICVLIVSCCLECSAVWRGVGVCRKLQWCGLQCCRLPCCSQANKLGYHNHYWPSLAQGPCMYHSETVGTVGTWI